MKDPELRAALTRLGARIATSRRARDAGRAGGRCSSAASSRAQDLSRDKLLDALPGDHVLGKADAPNIMIDYSSFTCPHCANFYVAVLPTLRKEWIDTGRLRLHPSPFPVGLGRHPGQPARRMRRPDKFFATVDAAVPQARSTG